MFGEKKPLTFLILLSMITLALLAAVFMHAYIGSFSRYLADDYCTAGELQRLGFWGSQVFWYTQWTGRFSFIFLVTSLELLGTEIVPYLPVTYIICFIFSGLFFTHNLLKKIRFKVPQLVSAFLAAVLVFLTLYTIPNIGQNLYWLTGSANYLFPVISSLFLFGLLIRLDHHFSDQSMIRKILGGVLIFLLTWANSGFSEVVAVLQFLILLFVNLHWRFSHEDKRFRLLWGIVFWGSLLGMVMMIVAPGNQIRMQAHNAERQHLFSLFMNAIEYFSNFSILWFLKHVNVIWPTGTLVIMVSFFARKLSGNLMENEINRIKTWTPFIVIVLILLVFASFLPSTWATSRAPENRVLIFPSVLLVILLIYICTIIGIFLSHAVLIDNTHHRFFSLAAIALVIYFMLAVPVFEARKVYYTKSEAAKFAERWDQREIEIREKIKEGQTQLAVKMIPTNLMEVEHLQSDPTHWINICAARYYGVEKISAE